VREEGQTIGEWSRRREPMRDEGDMQVTGKVYTLRGIAWRIGLAVAVVYVLLTAALVLTHG
jgi:hypothetical protein